MILLIRLIDMIPFNESSEDVSQVVRTNRDGRVRYTSEQKEKVLDLFEQSGMSGKAFAEEHGSSIRPLHCGDGNGGRADMGRKTRIRLMKASYWPKSLLEETSMMV